MQVTDLHRHKIDHITIPSPRGSEFGVLRRVEDVRPVSFAQVLHLNMMLSVT